MRYEKGGDLVEYALPTLLVGVVLGMGLYYLISSGQMTNFLMRSGKMRYDAPSKIAIVGQNTSLISNYEVNHNSDGSISFKVGNQDVTVPKTAIDLNNIAMETTGTSGINVIVSIIAEMINKHDGEYPPGQVPLDISFGTSDKIFENTEYKGSAAVNTTTVKVGDDVVILVNHQLCNGSCFTDKFYQQKITGEIAADNTFLGTLYLSTDPSSTSQTFSADVLTAGGGGFKIDALETVSGCGAVVDCYNSWSLDFSDTGNHFSL